MGEDRPDDSGAERGWLYVNRRKVLGASAAAAFAGAAAGILPSHLDSAADEDPAMLGPDDVSITLRVNNTEHAVTVEPRVTLLDALRERLGLTGTKKGCDRGECGACTVLSDDRRILSCTTLAVMAAHREITTIEGMADGDRLHPLQSAFIRHDALQCGFCTPGQIMSAVGLFREQRVSALTDDQIREAMSGNLCRCSCYPNIVAAIRDVSKHDAP